MKRYEQGSIGMRRDKNGPWCDYAEAQAEIERLRGLIVEVMSTRPHDPSQPYEVFTADISWKPRAAKACGVEVLEETQFVCSGMVIKDDEDGAA